MRENEIGERWKTKRNEERKRRMAVERRFRGQIWGRKVVS